MVEIFFAHKIYLVPVSCAADGQTRYQHPFPFLQRIGIRINLPQLQASSFVLLDILFVVFALTEKIRAYHDMVRCCRTELETTWRLVKEDGTV